MSASSLPPLADPLDGDGLGSYDTDELDAIAEGGRMFQRPISLRDDKSKALQTLRTWGYEDGYAGKEAVTKAQAYQEAWRRGREARRQDGLT